MDDLRIYIDLLQRAGIPFKMIRDYQGGNLPNSERFVSGPVIAVCVGRGHEGLFAIAVFKNGKLKDVGAFNR